jgi:hypothetical protein
MPWKECSVGLLANDRLTFGAHIPDDETCLLRLSLFSLRLRFAWSPEPSQTSGCLPIA